MADNGDRRWLEVGQRRPESHWEVAGGSSRWP